jgi:hypothetical protein
LAEERRIRRVYRIVLLLTLIFPFMPLVTRTTTFQSAYQLEAYQKYRLYLVMGMVLFMWTIVAVIAGIAAWIQAHGG